MAWLILDLLWLAIDELLDVGWAGRVLDARATASAQPRQESASAGLGSTVLELIDDAAICKTAAKVRALQVVQV